MAEKKKVEDEIKDKATSKLGAKHSKAKKVIHMRIEPTEEGGFVIDHTVHENGMPGKMTKHAVQHLDGLHDHMEEHYGEPEEGEQEAEAGNAGMEEEQESPAEAKAEQTQGEE